MIGVCQGYPQGARLSQLEPHEPAVDHEAASAACDADQTGVRAEQAENAATAKGHLEVHEHGQLRLVH